MSEYVVTDNHFDSAAEVYRLTIGFAREVETGRTEDDEPIMDTVFEPVEDFVFSSYDERWQGKDPDAIAKEQKRLVRAALKARQAPPEIGTRVELPGRGDKL